jgi:transcriptional regulator with XRE-family HTH domain
MTRPGLKSSLDRLGLKQAELARLLDVSPRTVSLWATGSAPLPGPVAAYLRLLAAAGPGVVGGEIKSLARRSKTLDEGIYGLSYKGEDAGLVDGGVALAVLRNGKILGSDRGGGVFKGSYWFDPVHETNRVHVRLNVPPEGQLVTGFAAGPEGAALDIVGSFERAAPVSAIDIEIDGRALEVQLTYLGPLPN